MDESTLIERNIVDAEGRAQVLIPLAVLAYILFFLGFHVVFSALFACIATLDFANEWLDVFVTNIKSSTFAHFSMGVPFAVFMCLFIQALFWTRRKSPEAIIQRMLIRDAEGNPACRQASAMELHNGDFYYDILAKVAKRAGIDTPRMFFIYNSPCVNATTADSNDGPVVALYQMLSCDNGYQPQHVAAFIAHELGHIQGHDNARSRVLNSAEYALSSFWIWGLRCRAQGRSMIEQSCGRGPAQALAAKMLVLTGWIYAIVGFLPYFFANRLRWLREYLDEYLADARGAKSLGSASLMAEALIIMAYRCNEWCSIPYKCTEFSMTKNDDVHPPSIERIRRLLPGFNGNIRVAGESILARYQNHQ